MKIIIILLSFSILITTNANEIFFKCYKYGEINIAVDKTTYEVKEYVKGKRGSSRVDFTIGYDLDLKKARYTMYGYTKGKPTQWRKLDILPFRDKNILLLRLSSKYAKENIPWSYEHIILNLKTGYAQTQGIPSLYTTIHHCIADLSPK